MLLSSCLRRVLGAKWPSLQETGSLSFANIRRIVSTCQSLPAKMPGQGTQDTLQTGLLFPSTSRSRLQRPGCWALGMLRTPADFKAAHREQEDPLSCYGYLMKQSARPSQKGKHFVYVCPFLRSAQGPGPPIFRIKLMLLEMCGALGLRLGTH